VVGGDAPDQPRPVFGSEQSRKGISLITLLGVFSISTQIGFRGFPYSTFFEKLK
jgi:hypothetical protein